MDLKEAILNAMAFGDYKRYYEQEIVGGLGTMSTSGDVKVNCVFHSDPDPSLSINLLSGLYNCFSGKCSAQGDIFQWQMERHNTDFKGALQYFADFLGIDAKKVKAKPKTQKKKPLGPPSAIYQYKDLTGQVVCETCKYENPKNFRQRRPHPTKKGEYLWNMKDVKIIPYNLQAVVESEVVYIVEGEKDADRLAQIGLVATCNPMGAGKWWDSMTPYFKDKVVVILPDNDEAGDNHAELVGGKLNSVAKSIQVVKLPSLKEGQDVSDWLSLGNTKADLLELVKAGKPYEDYLDYLNKRHAVVKIEGKTLIVNEFIDPTNGRFCVNYSSKTDFMSWYENRKIPNPDGNKPKMVSISKAWWSSADRRQYKSLLFSPKNDFPGHYNLWRGFAYEPKKGQWPLFREHIRKIICRGNVKADAWVMTWISRMIQTPGDRAKTALVLRGGQGTGKGVFLSNYGKLLGCHFLQISHQQHLVSRFNQHFQNLVLLYVDEGWWAGNKQSEGVIKGLITEDTIPIEAKGINIKDQPNFLTLAMASNSDWIVPSAMDERRFCVLDVCDSMQQNKRYFGNIQKELDAGGYEAMLYDLLEYDISKVDVTQIIPTSAGLDQKLQSLDSVGQFWDEELMFGRFLEFDPKYKESDPVLIDEIQEKYLDLCQEINERYPQTRAGFGKKLRKYCPEMRVIRKNSVDSGGKTIRKRYYIFPNIHICRDLFDKTIRYERDWDTDMAYIDGEFEEI